MLDKFLTEILKLAILMQLVNEREYILSFLTISHRIPKDLRLSTENTMYHRHSSAIPNGVISSVLLNILIIPTRIFF